MTEQTTIPTPILEEQAPFDERLEDLVVETQRPAVIHLPEVATAKEPLGAGFKRLWAAITISNLGDGARLAALPLLAASISTDPIAISALLFASKLPWLLLSLHAGALADRLDRKRLIVGVTAARAAVMMLLVIAAAGGWLSLPLLYAVAVAQGIGEVFVDNTSFALLPSIVPKSRLEDANGRLEASMIVSNEFAGPAIGAALFALAVALPFSLDAVSFIAAALLIGSLPTTSGKRSIPSSRPSLWSDIREGLGHMWSDTVLRDLSLVAGVTNLVLFATFGIQVLYALEVLNLGPQGFGLLLCAEALGAMCGSLFAARARQRFGMRTSIVIALALAGAANLVLWTTSSWFVAGAMALLVSVGGGLWNVITNSYRQKKVPGHLLGRIQSAHRVISWGAMPVGTLLGGLLAKNLGLRVPFLLAGLGLVAMSAGVAALMRAVND